MESANLASAHGVESKAAPIAVERLLDPHADDSPALVADVRAGLAQRPRSLPPKYFYDAHGAEVFDAICRTPEYYPTRTEDQLLARVAPEIVAQVGARALVELGSGAARKTHRILEPMLRELAANERALYVPVDVAEEMLWESARRLRARFPRLLVRGLVADFIHHLDRLPDESERFSPRLFAFLGGTIGNFELEEGAAFLRHVAAQMGPADALLMGVDLVKDSRVLNAAYNDAAGHTAEFNRNVLRVLNRRLDADFPVEAFAHVAFYDEERERIEMHLEAMRAMRVRVPGAELDLELEEGERIHTEISRKFQPRSLRRLVERAELELEELYTSEDGYFGLALMRR